MKLKQIGVDLAKSLFQVHGFDNHERVQVRKQHQFCNKLVIRIFVDSLWLHKFWGCHRFPERSFFVEGRQFHICARCTGLVVGLPCSLLLLPMREGLPYVFTAFAILLVADGLTQFAQWRVSNNKLRFFAGFGTAVTFFPSLLTIVGY